MNGFTLARNKAAGCWFWYRWLQPRRRNLVL